MSTEAPTAVRTDSIPVASGIEIKPGESHTFALPLRVEPFVDPEKLSGVYAVAIRDALRGGETVLASKRPDGFWCRLAWHLVGGKRYWRGVSALFIECVRS